MPKTRRPNTGVGKAISQIDPRAVFKTPEVRRLAHTAEEHRDHWPSVLPGEFDGSHDLFLLLWTDAAWAEADRDTRRVFDRPFRLNEPDEPGSKLFFVKPHPERNSLQKPLELMNRLCVTSRITEEDVELSNRKRRRFP